MRVLFVHRARTHKGLGYTIRVQRILEFLRSSHLDVREAPLPSISVDLKRGSFHKVIPYIFPIKSKRFFSAESLSQHVGLNLSYNYLWRFCKEAKFDVILAETSIIGSIATQVGKKLSIPTIVDVHGLAGAEARGNQEKNWMLKEKLESRVFKDADHLLVVSNAMKEHVGSNFHVNLDKISVVPNGSELYTRTAEYVLPFKVIYAGMFAYWEKVTDFLEVARAASPKDFSFHILGTGSQKQQVLQRMVRERIPIKFLGYLPRDQTLEKMSGMQVGVAPSTNDIARIVAFPIKVLDYMACGLPVVAPKVGDWGKMIEQEDCGISMKRGTIEDYLAAFEELKERPVWKRKSRNAREAIRTKYDWNLVLSPIKNVVLNATRK